MTVCVCVWMGGLCLSFPPSFCLLIIPCADRYCLSGLPVDCQMKNITNPDQTSLLLEDLIIWTNYEIEVAAYNGAGRGTYSHKVTEWTLQGGKRVVYLKLYISMEPKQPRTSCKCQLWFSKCFLHLTCYKVEIALFGSTSSIHYLQPHHVSPLDDVKPEAQNLWVIVNPIICF